jgi:hypothetical protein
MNGPSSKIKKLLLMTLRKKQILFKGYRAINQGTGGSFHEKRDKKSREIVSLKGVGQVGVRCIFIKSSRSPPPTFIMYTSHYRHYQLIKYRQILH